MRQALLLTAALTAAFLLVESALGPHLAAQLGFGAITVIAAVNAGTFLWLFWARTTPLALGMAFSWFGQAALSIWLFANGIPANVTWTSALDSAAVLLFLSCYIVGGALHIAVMQRSMELARSIMIWPILAAFVVAFIADALL